MYKPSKLLNILFTFFFLSFFGLMGYLAIEMIQAEKANNSQQSDFVTFEYKVSRIDSDGLYADSTADNTGIFITQERLQPNNHIKEGDLILVYFDSEKFSAGIEHVEVIENGE